MEIELVPELGPADPVLLAAEAAIEQAGLADDVRPAGNTSAWWRAGVHEAVEGRLASREQETAIGRAETGVARSRASRPDASGSV